MCVSSLATYLQVVDERRGAWTGKALADLPNFPSRSDVDQLAKAAWFRGHSEAGWKLIPSVYRIEGYTLDRERAMNRMFVHTASFLGESMPSQGDFPAWLSKMQHHGAPTRLLDWTENSAMGLYFALKDHACYARWKRSCWFHPVVWMINPHALNWISTSGSIIPTTDLNEFVGSERDGWVRAWGCRNVFPAFGLSPQEAYEGPMAVRPTPVDPRMHAQRSRFTVHGKRPDPIEEMFKATPERDLEKRGFLYRIEIDPTATGAMIRELRDIGVSSASVFPDIEGVSMEVAELF